MYEGTWADWLNNRLESLAEKERKLLQGLALQFGISVQELRERIFWSIADAENFKSIDSDCPLDSLIAEGALVNLEALVVEVCNCVKCQFLIECLKRP